MSRLVLHIKQFAYSSSEQVQICCFLNVNTKHCTKNIIMNKNTHTHNRLWPFSRTARVSQCQKRTSGLYDPRED